MPGVSTSSAAQQRLRRVRELEELEDRQDPEHRTEDGERPDRRHARAGGRRRRGEPELEHATQVARAEQREHGHDRGVHDEDRDRRLDEHLEPVAAADRDDPGEAAEEDVRRELERAAVHRAGDDRDDGHDDRRERRVEQDREDHPDRRGRQEVRQDRAAGGELERDRGAGDEQPDQHEHVVAVPEPRPEAPQPAEQDPDEQDAEDRPAAEASRGPGPARRSARAHRSSRCRRSVSRSPLRTRISRWRTWTITGGTASTARASSWAVSSALNEEFGTTSGLMSSAARSRSRLDRGRRPSAPRAGSSSPRRRCRAVRPARARRGRGPPRFADGRPVGRRERRERRRDASSERFGIGDLEQRRALLRRGGRPRRWCPTRETRLLEGDLLRLGDGDGVVGGEVVLRLDRRPAPAPARPSVCDALSKSSVFGRDDVARREVAGLVRSSGCCGRMSAPRTAVRMRIEDHGRDPEAGRVVAREPGDRVDALGQHRSVRPGVVRGEVRLGQGGRHHPAHDLAVGAAAGPRREPAHDLAEVPGGGRAGRGDTLVDERGDLRLGQGLGQVVAEDRRSRPPPWSRGPRGRRPGTPRPIPCGS